MAMQDALCIHLPSCFGTPSYQPTSAFSNEATAAGRVFNSCATFHEGKNWNRHIWDTHQFIFWGTFVCFKLIQPHLACVGSLRMNVPDHWAAVSIQSISKFGWVCHAWSIDAVRLLWFMKMEGREESSRVRESAWKELLYPISEAKATSSSLACVGSMQMSVPDHSSVCKVSLVQCDEALMTS